MEYILLLSADSERLRLETGLLTDELRAAGWIISTKGHLEPTTDISWKGKHLDGGHYSLMQCANYMATTTALWVS